MSFTQNEVEDQSTASATFANASGTFFVIYSKEVEISPELVAALEGLPIEDHHELLITRVSGIEGP